MNKQEINAVAVTSKGNNEKKEELLLNLKSRIELFIKNKNYNIPGYEREDLYQIGYMAFLKAVDYYNEELGDFTPYMFQWVKKEILQEKRHLNTYKKRANFDAASLHNINPDTSDEMGEILDLGGYKTPEDELYLNESLNEFYEVLESRFQPETQEIIKLFLAGYSQKEIVSMLNLENIKQVNNAMYKLRTIMREIRGISEI